MVLEDPGQPVGDVGRDEHRHDDQRDDQPVQHGIARVATEHRFMTGDGLQDLVPSSKSGCRSPTRRTSAAVAGDRWVTMRRASQAGFSVSSGAAAAMSDSASARVAAGSGPGRSRSTAWVSRCIWMPLVVTVARP